MGLSRVVVRLDIRGLNDRTQFIPVAMASLLALRPAYILRIIATVGRYCNPDVEVYTRKQSIKVTVAGYWEGGRDNGSRAAARELSVDFAHHLLCG